MRGTINISAHNRNSFWLSKALLLVTHRELLEYTEMFYFAVTYVRRTKL